jgi:NAD(P)-dependent dehydrogenase (short-subunit alcohol dehydrogenase family)
MAVVLITGCSRGIGLLTALRFAREGDRVFATMRDLSLAGEIERRLESDNLSVEVLQLDVRDCRSIRKAVDGVLASAGRIDVLVNNAAIGWHGPVEDADLAEARAVFETNFFGPVRLIQAVLPTMRKQRSGAIVTVSSLAGFISEPYNGIYSASKHALEALSEALYFELHPFGVRVTIIEPGGFRTRGYEVARAEPRYSARSPHLEYGQRFDEAIERLPELGQPGDPQVVADAVYAAVYREPQKVRHQVGEGAAEIVALRRRLDDEAFEQTMRKTLDIWD